MKEKKHVSELVSRRRVLQASAGMAALGLSGCVTTSGLGLKAGSSPDANSPFGKDFGGELRAREIFNLITKKTPVPIRPAISQTQTTSHNQKSLAAYQEAKIKLQAKYDDGQTLTAQEIARDIGEPLSEIIVCGLRQAAREDKGRVLQRSTSSGIQKIDSRFIIPSGMMLS